MLTPKFTSEQSGTYINPIQTKPERINIYGINRCEDQVIGFEFVAKQYIDQPIKCCNSAFPHLCTPIEISSPIVLENVEFWATEDSCYQDWTVKKVTAPFIEVQRDSNNNATGILVRFSKNESCCYPVQMAFRLLNFDSTGCKYSIATGLLVFR
jgi:hypothetical protein